MTERAGEVWAVGPTDAKAHLYIDDGCTKVRRLCHRALVAWSDLSPIGDTEKCRLCQNIRGLIPTSRGRKRKATA